MTEYKIFYDSNALFNKKGELNDPFTNAASDLHEFLKKNKVLNRVQVCIPELVISERIHGMIERIQQTVDAANERLASLEAVGHDKLEIPKKDDYEQVLQTKAAEFIKKYSIERVPTDMVKTEVLLERAVSKMKPFDDGGAGFKDTLIFLTIVAHAKQQSKGTVEYVLCSGDKAFDDQVIEEFLEVTGKKLHIVREATSVTVKLDELLPLHLSLEERNSKLKAVVGKNLGDIMIEINKEALPVRRNFVGGYGGTVTTFADFYDNYNPMLGTVEKPEDIAGFNFLDADFTRFEEVSDKKFVVLVNINTKIRYMEESAPLSVDVFNTTYINTGFSLYGKRYNRTFEVHLTCDLQKGAIKINHIS